MKQQLNFKTYSSFKKFKEDEEKGILYIEGYASKAYENGKPVVDFDGEFVKIEGFDLTTCTTLLFNHNHKEYAVGKCVLEHRPDGAYLYGELHEAMNDKVYYAVKHGIMTDFSVGFAATDYAYQKINNEDILTFTEGFVFETSIVNLVGANKFAKIEASKSLRKDRKGIEVIDWLNKDTAVKLDKETEVKSIIENGKCVGFSCSIEALKKANPDQDCSCITTQEDEGNMEKKATIAEIIKGLTFEETLQDTWNEKQRLNHYLEVLAETISDNWYETIWGEEITPDEAKANILAAISAFTVRLDEFTSLQNDTATVTKSVTKTADVVKEVVTPEGSEEEEVQPEAEVQTPEQEEVQEVAEETKEVATESVEDIVEGETKEETPVEEIVEPKVIGAKDVLDLVDGLNLDNLSDDEIKNIYETFTDKIENYVREALQGEEV